MAQDKLSNIELRTLSGVMIVAIFTISILWIPPLFQFLLLMIGTGMFIEWYNITKKSIPDMLLGLIIIPAPIVSLLVLSLNEYNKSILLTYFVTIWSVDTFAMIGGKNLKGPKLAPKLSPHKTWSGLIVGVTSAGAAAALVSSLPIFDISQHYLFNKRNLILSSMFIALLAQVSDLFISHFKRKFSVKDSGNLIPGHGGVLDRFDSIILTAPVLLWSVYHL